MKLTWKNFADSLRPASVFLSALRACCVSTDARLKRMAAFSKWMLHCSVFLLCLNASYHVKAMEMWPVSLLIGNLVSIRHSAL
jgi:hypothetical protein